MHSSRFPKPVARRSAPGEKQEDGPQRAGRESGRDGRPPRRRPDFSDRPDRRAPPEQAGRPRPRPDAPARSPRRSGQTPEEARNRETLAAQRSETVDASLLPGVKPVRELLESAPERIDVVYLRKGRRGREAEQIVDLCRAAGVRFSLLDTAPFARIYEGRSQGVVARLFEAGYADLDDVLMNVMDAPLPLVLALDQVQDPGNAGTLARTLYALGGAGMVIPRHNGVYLGPAAVRASAGALERLPVAKAANLGQAVDAARKAGFTVYGAASSSQEESGALPVVDVFDLVPRFPALLLLGSEEAGLRQGVEKRCDALVRIPMLRLFDSLNVAQAGAVILAWLSRAAGQR